MANQEANVIVVKHTYEDGVMCDTTIIVVADPQDYKTIVAIGESIEVVEQDLLEKLGIKEIGWDDIAPYIRDTPYYLNSSLYIVTQNSNPLSAVTGLAQVAPFLTPAVWTQLENSYQIG